MKAQDVIEALDRIGQETTASLVYTNTKTHTDVFILREHGMFKLMLLYGGVIYFDGYKQNCVYEDMFNIFLNDDEIGKVDTKYWEI